jgi:hypothetical protein
MIKEMTKHRSAYLILAVGLVSLVILFMGVWPNRVMQRLVAIAFGVFYIVWGLITHLHSDHINKHVVMEYLGVGSVGSLVLLLITW